MEKLRYQMQAVVHEDLLKNETLRELHPYVQPSFSVVVVEKVNQAMAFVTANFIKAVANKVEQIHSN